jgi:rare lipoprotein A
MKIGEMGMSKNQTPGATRLDAPQGRILLKAATVVAAAALLASCASAPSKPSKRSKEYFSEKEYGVKASPRVVKYGQAVPQGGGRYMVGKPYTVKGRVYTPRENPRYTATGLASWYGSAFHGRYTANGEVYDMDGLSAAHPTMPLPSYARVTNTKNGRSVVVRVNDRGPYAHDRVIDLSSRTAEVLDMKHHGTAKVKVEYVGPARMEGHDQKMLMATYEGPGSSVSGSTMLALKAPSFRAPSFRAPAPAPIAAPTVMMASLAPIPRSRPETYDGGNAYDPALVAYQAQPQRRVVADASPMPAAQPIPAGSNYGERSLGTITYAEPIGYQDQGMIPAVADDYYEPPRPRSNRSSYAAEPAASPSQRAVAEMATGRSDLQVALDAAVGRAAADRSADAAIIQLGVFANAANADQLAARFADLGRVTTTPMSVGGKSMQSVRLVVAGRAVTGVDAIAKVKAAGLSGAYLVTR